MKKKWLGIGLVVALVVGLAVTGSWALDKGPEKITINAQEKYPELITKKDKKKTPDFTHHKHADEYLKWNAEFSNFKYTDDYTCAGCHHTNKAGEQPEGCLKCKDVEKQLEKVGGAKKFDKLYHISCRDGCHKAMADAGKKSGPTKKDWRDKKKCVGCHPKKKKW